MNLSDLPLDKYETLDVVEYCDCCGGEAMYEHLEQLDEYSYRAHHLCRDCYSALLIIEGTGADLYLPNFELYGDEDIAVLSLQRLQLINFFERFHNRHQHDMHRADLLLDVANMLRAGPPHPVLASFVLDNIVAIRSVAYAVWVRYQMSHQIKIFILDLNRILNPNADNEVCNNIVQKYTPKKRRRSHAKPLYQQRQP